MANPHPEHPAKTFLKSLYKSSEPGFINLRFLPSGMNSFIPLAEIDCISNILDLHKGRNAYFMATEGVKT
jgi:hypothetical protein